MYTSTCVRVSILLSDVVVEADNMLGRRSFIFWVFAKCQLVGKLNEKCIDSKKTTTNKHVSIIADFTKYLLI